MFYDNFSFISRVIRMVQKNSQTFLCLMLLSQIIMLLPLENKGQTLGIVNVKHQVTNEPLDKAMVIKEKVSQGKDTFFTNRKGEVKIKLQANYSYNISATKSGFQKHDKILRKEKVEENDTIEIKIALSRGPLFHRALFYKKNEIRPINNWYLDTIYKVLRENKGLVIKLRGHSSCKEKYPQKISRERIKWVKNKLISLGINEKRLKLKAFGPKKPLNKCNCKNTQKINCTKEHFQFNRRVSGKIVDDNFNQE
jgi:outer membrane protein OmpA-like peptidoglycan-associated protein